MHTRPHLQQVPADDGPAVRLAHRLQQRLHQAAAVRVARQGGQRGLHGESRGNVEGRGERVRHVGHVDRAETGAERGKVG